MHRSQHGWSRYSALFGLGVLLLQVTAAAQAQAPVPALLQKARRHFDNLEYERALVELLGAQRLTRTQDERVSLLLLKGIVLAELGKKAEASGAFREALRLKPGAVLPPDVSPKITRQFEAVSEALAVAELEPKERPTKPGPRPPPPPVNAVQAGNADVQGQSHAQPPATLPQINVVVSPTQEVNIAPPVTPLPASATPSGEVDVHRSRVLEPHILIPAGAGGALAIAGGIFWGLARKELKKIESGDPRLNSLAAVEDSASNGRTYQTVGFSLMGAGLVGLGLAASMYGMDRTGSPPVEFIVGTNGTQALLHGRW